MPTGFGGTRPLPVVTLVAGDRGSMSDSNSLIFEVTVIMGGVNEYSNEVDMSYNLHMEKPVSKL
ncbi:hypothetical protein GQX74_007677 [Glossina fuscipes]|uniref:Uncharacterized protein n=1 Tax=Glossina palpalis gambiensis TaxID=67801 RepID=A0A1B0BQR7_9MUSC|nr:hypothetical protein GQX74_007677 [Glossina fuscipes]